ncbi:MAG: hypothetical protein WB781_03875 [Candidatus Sulfotelmatobacter sp.]
MMSLTIIRSELMQARNQLTKSSAFLKGAGQSVSSPSAPRNEADLEKVVVKLKSLLRDLAAQENLAHMQKWNAPAQSSSRWIHGQKEREAREVLEEALALKQLAEELLVKNGLLSPMDTAGGLIKFANQIDGEVAQILSSQHHVQVPDRPAYLPSQPGMHPLGADSATAVLAWIVLAVQWMKKKRISED